MTAVTPAPAPTSLASTMTTPAAGLYVAAVVVFAFRGERLLALRRSDRNEAAPGAWEAISGRIDPGEQPADTAMRETREETGLEIRLVRRPITAYRSQRNRKDMIVVVYRAGAGPGEGVPSDENQAFAWLTLDEFARTCPFAGLVDAARQAAYLV